MIPAKRQGMGKNIVISCFKRVASSIYRRDFVPCGLVDFQQVIFLGKLTRIVDVGRCVRSVPYEKERFMRTFSFSSFYCSFSINDVARIFNPSTPHIHHAIYLHVITDHLLVPRPSSPIMHKGDAPERRTETGIHKQTQKGSFFLSVACIIFILAGHHNTITYNLYSPV